MTAPATLAQVLDQAAAAGHGLTLVGASGPTDLRAAELRHRALALLGRLQAEGMEPGHELVLHTADLAAFLTGFWAAVLGGLVPVPIALGAGDEHRRKVLRILEHLRRPRLLTEAGTLRRLAAFLTSAGQAGRVEPLEAATILLDRAGDGASGPGRPHAAAPDDLAFVQFSSGSTSDPRGVMLTHANLLANVRGIVAAARVAPEDRPLSWMPLTHDMGLIGFHLAPLARGCDHALMPTELFVRRPLTWLQGASSMGATLLCSPNFGYQHVLRALERHDPGPLDLAAVRLIFNGAEPISVRLCREFLDRLASSGLDPAAMFPVYGLAEASVAVSFPEVGTGLTAVHVDRARLSVGDAAGRLEPGDPAAVPFACVGRCVPECSVRITAADGSELPAPGVGHIEIRGANVTSGYYRDEAATRSVRRDDGWLDTGDLGFLDAAGLVVTGRHKEVIFANGQNFYPHDVETLIQHETGIEPGKVVAAGTRSPDAPADELLVFLVHKGDLAPLAPAAATLTAALNAQLGLDVTRVVPVPRLPKTTSGKIQRHRLVEDHAAGRHESAAAELAAHVAALSTAATPGGTAGEPGPRRESLEQTLRGICQRVLVDREVGSEDNLFEIGTSSVELAQIHEGIEVSFPGVVDITDLFDYPTIAALAALLEERCAAPPGRS